MPTKAATITALDRAIRMGDTYWVEKYQRDLEERALLPENQKLATELHETLCHWNHTDGCAWFYEKEWTDRTHKDYLTRADQILEIADAETALLVVEIAGQRTPSE